MLKHKDIINKLRNKHLSVNIDGYIKYNPTVIYIIFTIFIFKSLTEYILDSIKEREKYLCTFAVHQTSLYGKFVEYILQLNKVPYHVIYHNHLVNMAYMSENEYITINPQPNDFLDAEVSLIPLSEEELNDLEKHTGFTNLVKCQNKILRMTNKINAYQIVTNHHEGERITTINNNTINDQLRYKYILSDYISPVNTGDIINATYYNQIDRDIYIENKFVLNQYHQLVPLNDELREDVNQLPFYSLEYAREPLRFHPFHLPKTVDIVLSLMILTQACIDNL